MTAPAIRPCKCRATPAFHRGQRGDTYMLQLVCACGEKGAMLMFTKREQAARMEQAAIDGWNLAG